MKRCPGVLQYCGREVTGFFAVRCPECEAEYRARLQSHNQQMNAKKRELQILQAQFFIEHPYACGPGCNEYFSNEAECERHRKICNKRQRY